MKLKAILKNLQIKVEDELARFEHLLSELQEALKDDYVRFRARICAGILDDFYMGVEKIFKEIADKIDLQIPQGKDWHKKLLLQMKIETETRPAVIDEVIYIKIEEYLRFRHMNRNVYGFYFDWDKMSYLVYGLEDVVYGLKKALNIWFNQMFLIVDELERGY